MSSSILYSNEELTIFLIDIIKSIELAQDPTSRASDSHPRLLSCVPLARPFPSLDAKSKRERGDAVVGSVSLEDLLTEKLLSLSLVDTRRQHRGLWCSPRVTASTGYGEEALVEYGMRGNSDRGNHILSLSDHGGISLPSPNGIIEVFQQQGAFLFQNRSTNTVFGRGPQDERIHMPPRSTGLLGQIDESLPIFLTYAPKFDLIILDPPWPNRSARRKHSYGISYNTSEIHQLLSSIPISLNLADDGLLAIWTTNKPVLHDLILCEGGLFDLWGVRLIEKWIWLKVTTTGEPTSAIDGSWRKPYETLFIGRRSATRPEEVKKRVILAVPDLHSRKPNLKELMERLFTLTKGQYEALEVFARNLTAEWWSWGDECLKFQGTDCWVDTNADGRASLRNVDGSYTL